MISRRIHYSCTQAGLSWRYWEVETISLLGVPLWRRRFQIPPSHYYQATE